MKRLTIAPRDNWTDKCEDLGFGFYDKYWNESAEYEFTMDEITRLETATQRIWDMCLEAVQHVIDKSMYAEFGIPDKLIDEIKYTWDYDAPSLYARLDLDYNPDTGQIKLFEINADTPTALYESAVVQWFWLKDVHPDKDQFNSIHDKVIAKWRDISTVLYPGHPVYFTCVRDSLEDLTTVEYLRDCAIQADLHGLHIYIDDIGYNGDIYMDLDDHPITQIFKLYPWEFMFEEEFGIHVPYTQCMWIEPTWRYLLSNKAILPVLWDMYPDHDLLLPASYEPLKGNYVSKPCIGREGSNIDIVINNMIQHKTPGVYKGKRVYQGYVPSYKHDQVTACIGSWIIGDEPAGICVRETNGLVTNNTSLFVPHFINTTISNKPCV